ncbi:MULTISPECIES: RNA polymerase sigma factor SigF [unclassified Streptomyces]|uniref:RNA polymerase sigma factor SigF n=1 Tax=unclassified Streptomyces TaxID=2593676 RepID=UPI0003A7C8FB|nr:MULTISPECIES: RNA polymerase sigma factor SigF [unclassified Streptomyces]MYY02502.1 SigB/SigF/SigG family RNA polymerase sigma factor [Streptomyces sp. SID4913]
MSPRLDEPRTQNAASACPQGLTESDSPAATVPNGTRTDSTSSGSDRFTRGSAYPHSAAHMHGVISTDTHSAAFDTDGLEGLPEIPPYTEVGALDARALSKTLFARLESLEEGTPEYSYVRNTLVELNLALVKFAASRFRSRSEPMEDIVQVGTIGLIKAIDRFELSRGVEFPTFAMPTIVGEIKRFFRDTSWSVRVPRRLQELRLDLAKAGDELAQQLDRAPTVGELADRLGLSRDEVLEGMAASNAYTASSLDAKPEEDEHEGALADRIGYEDHGLEGIEYVESLKPLIAVLPDRDRKILSLRFVANMTQSEIGEELGISQMHVSRLLSRTLVKLRRGLTLDE